MDIHVIEVWPSNEHDGDPNFNTIVRLIYFASVNNVPGKVLYPGF